MGCGLCTAQYTSKPTGMVTTSRPSLLISKEASLPAEFSGEEQAKESIKSLQTQLEVLNSKLHAIESDLQSVVTASELSLQPSTAKEELGQTLKRLGACQVEVTQAYIQARTSAQLLQRSYLLVRGATAGLEKRLRAWPNSLGTSISETVAEVETCGALVSRLCTVEPSENLLFALKQAKRELTLSFAASLTLLKQTKAVVPDTSEEGDGYTEHIAGITIEETAEIAAEEQIIEEFSAQAEVIEEVLVAAEAPDYVSYVDTDMLSARTSVQSPYRYSPAFPLKIATVRPKYPLLECLVGPLVDRYEKYVEIAGLYSESVERRNQMGLLSRFLEESEEKEGVIMNEKQLFTVLSETFLEKAVNDRRKLGENQPIESLDTYLLASYQDHRDELLSLLQSLRFLARQNHPTALLFCKILNFATDNPYPQAISLTITLFAAYLPPTALPLAYGQVFLGDVLFLLQQLFEELPEAGIALLQAIRPSKLPIEKFVHFLISFKAKYLNCHEIFTLLAGEEDKMPIKALASGLKQQLGLWVSDTELITALQALNPTSKGLVTRVAFLQACNIRRLAKVSKRQEYFIETTAFVEIFAEFCLRMRRCAIENLASAYIHRGKLSVSEAFERVTGVAGDVDDFETMLETAEKQLLGPFATVHCSNFHAVRLCRVSTAM